MDGTATKNLPAVDAAPSSATATPVPALLDSQVTETYRQQFLEHYAPVGPLERALVHDLARQAAAVDRWSAAAEAVERHAARNLPDLIIGSHRDEVASQDAVLAGAMSTEIAERCERQSLARSRAFHRVSRQLGDVQAMRRQLATQPNEFAIPPSFADEAACEVYLATRWRDGRQPCPRCGFTTGYLLTTRRSWECGGCQHQCGWRTGMVMARSPLALHTWFEAIRWLLWQPTISTTTLGEKLGLQRPTTIRLLAQKIRTAMAAEDATHRLAGLDVYWARAT